MAKAHSLWPFRSFSNHHTFRCRQLSSIAPSNYSCSAPQQTSYLSPPRIVKFDSTASAYPISVAACGPTSSAYISSIVRGSSLIQSQPSILQSSEHESNHTGMEPEPERQDELSDQEWEIRTGRAIYILQQTLPDFFATGLVSNLDTSVTSSSSQEENASEKESIYSPKIRLSYTPPTPLPSPFPRTLHVEGLPLYMASSAFVRHTLNALYTDLRVELRRVRVHGPRSPPNQGSVLPPGLVSEPAVPIHQHRSMREKSLFVGLAVSGNARVSGAEGGWEVNSTYTFSPITGLIYLHTIDSIYPAPHQAVYDALRAALVKLGLTGGQQGGEGVARNSTGKV